MSEAGVVYTPNVLVMRRATGGPLLPPEEQFRISVVTVAAQDLRPALHQPFGKAYDRSLCIEKMRSLLWAAASRGHDSLVLGALGCGAFRHDPQETARAFASLLTEPGAEFAGVFRVVLFGIIFSETNLGAFAKSFALTNPEELMRTLSESSPAATAPCSARDTESETET